MKSSPKNLNFIIIFRIHKEKNFFKVSFSEEYYHLLIYECVFSSHPEDGLLLKDWGRVVAQFIGNQWMCLSFLQKTAGTLRAPEAPEVLRAAVDALALLPGHLVLPVLDFMASVLPQVGRKRVGYRPYS